MFVCALFRAIIGHSFILCLYEASGYICILIIVGLNLNLKWGWDSASAPQPYHRDSMALPVDDANNFVFFPLSILETSWWWYIFEGCSFNPWESFNCCSWFTLVRRARGISQDAAAPKAINCSQTINTTTTCHHHHYSIFYSQHLIIKLN